MRRNKSMGLSVILIICLAGVCRATDLPVVYPKTNSYSASATTSIVIQFTSIIQPISVNQKSFQVWGTNSGPISGSFSISGDGKSVTFSHSKKMHAGELIQVGFGPVTMLSGEVLPAFHWQFFIRSASRAKIAYNSPVQKPATNPSIAHVIDFNQDGEIDLVSKYGTVFQNSNHGSNFNVVSNQMLDNIKQFGDYNNDGVLDFIKELNTKSGFFYKVCLGDGNGGFITKPTIWNTDLYVAQGDITGDNVTDLLFYNSGTLKFYRGVGDGTFIADTTVFSFNGALETLQLCDVNNDGSLDICLVSNPYLTTEPDHEVKIWLNNGKGIFPVSTWRALSDYALDKILFTDFTNDGLIDLVTSSLTTGARLYLGDGAGNFSNFAMWGIGHESGSDILTADMNGDTKPDLILNSWMIGGETGSNALVGGTVYITGTVVPSGGSFVYHTDIYNGIMKDNVSGTGFLADLNDDGTPDLVTGNSGFVNFILSTDSANTVSDKVVKKNNFVLEENYPNPFNPVTTISYLLPEKISVKITIYNALGQKITVLIDKEESPGKHTVKWNAANNVSGQYFCEFRAGAQTEYKKLILMK
ncbi:MAG: T9SS type A sorting domain-containing protein [Ignavibacteria bacterium]|nr:T9SS type A sorting domain-containing protein [Ignavibacteria bacterium]